MPTLAFLVLATLQEPPPGWLPVNRLDDGPAWSEFRKLDDKVHLYLPPGVEAVRGVFVCFVFHSGDPRELARLWKFALVTVPWPFEYDLGHNDKRNGRWKAGHPMQDMGLLLRYLDAAARDAGRPELASAPLVGWLGQNGSHLCADLLKRAPDRVLAWSDAFADRLGRYPELTAAVPFAYAWEFTKKEAAERAEAAPEDRPSPPKDFKCRANTYGFPHGIYSKFNFFMAYLDRCIALRMPDELPPPGKPVPLKPLVLERGWAGDYAPIGEWNPIAPVPEAKGMIEPGWLPDAYAAWTWRAYHSANPDLKLSAPVVEYRKAGDRWGGPDCGLGYGAPVAAGTPLRFAAETAGDYVKVEFHDGDRVVGTDDAPPWALEGVRLDRGLRALFAVGVKPDGSRRASRPAFLVVE
jgi:hypothetical protein